MTGASPAPPLTHWLAGADLEATDDKGRSPLTICCQPGMQDVADILLKAKLDALAKEHADRFDVLYVLDRPPSVWTGGAGFITAEMLAARLPPPGASSKVFVCGPPGMMKVVSGAKVSPKDQGEVLGHLKALGYDKDMVFKF